jgi:UDP-3-O-[3-hydroxymyristoyl] glucosamine N-acyltransferase
MSGTKSFTLKALAETLGAHLEGDPEKVISGFSDLDGAGEADASFLANPRYEGAARISRAGVIIIAPNCERFPGKNFLIASDPSRAFQQLLELFVEMESFTSFTGIHPTAIVHQTAKIGPDVNLGPYAVIDAGVEIGAKTTIGAFVYIGRNTKIGAECLLYPHVVVRERCAIGNRVIIEPGAVLGGCGFGFTQDELGRHTKLNQLGTVVIEDDVELGANVTIDRARFEATKIGQGSKVDNLVDIAHGVKVGKHNIIVAQCGIAGSTELGDHVILGGQVGLVGHIKLCDHVMVAGRSGISKSITKPGKYGGVPAMPLAEYNRMAVHLQNIEKLVEEHKALLHRVEELEKEISRE